ncbi:MAG TPA: enoyl-CoA hydratase/isomerase family protein [candidate division Zixibacteria bacterium]|nr:enoyl-CoA hydratase/isomerase family protein [candidate division Zixibacteria bacterium]
MSEPPSPTPRDPALLGLERVRYTKDRESGVATVAIDRPEVLNAFDFLTLRELARCFEDASWDDTVAVVVVTGAGDRAFCTGADLDEQATFGATSGQYWRWMGAFIEMHDRLRNIGKPTIARINGVCVGGGQELQLACDLSVMVDDAYIRHVGPEHGSVPAGGATQWLPIVVGDRRAREIIMLCEEISPARALEWGLVSRVVPRAELDATVAELAEKLRRKLPETIRYTKTQLNWWRDLVWAQTITHARDWLAVHSGSDEVREAVAAFHEKREPSYAVLRETLVAGGRACRSCGERGLSSRYEYCPMCGAALTALQEGVP